MRILEILRVRWIKPIFQFRVPSWIIPWTGSSYLQTSDNFPNECRGYRQNSGLIQFFSCFECLYRLNWESICILDFCTIKDNMQCVFLYAPILTESYNHFCFEESL